MVNEGEYVIPVYKCGGIPMYPAEYSYEGQPPIGYTEDDEKNRKEHLCEFLNEIGIVLSDIER
jgi:hypothetical protein